MENSTRQKYQVNGMSCGGCASTVKNKLSTVLGVTSVQIDVAKKEAEIVSSEVITISKLQDALKDTHYTIAEN